MVQIFISYAREDYQVVRQLYDRLQAAGYKPWMDKVDLPKGADFAKAIPKVLRESDLFIVCLSPRSVEKRSFIQREINLALDAWEQKLEDDLYIFPVRLEACKAPERISKFNWTDLFGDEHEEEWNALLQALNAQAQRLSQDVAVHSAHPRNFERAAIEEQFSTRRFEIIRRPTFTDLPTQVRLREIGGQREHERI